MSENSVLPLAHAYHELSHLLFMLEMSYLNPSSVDGKVLKCEIDELIAQIHAHNVIESINLKKI